MTIPESNALIAVFMGGIYLRKKEPFDGRIIEYIRFEKGVFRDMCWNGKNGAAVENQIGELLYHAYWDWLMPVVEKIEAGSQRDVLIYDKVCRIDDPNIGRRFMGAGKTKIEAVYEAVVEYINHPDNKL